MKLNPKLPILQPDNEMDFINNTNKQTVANPDSNFDESNSNKKTVFRRRRKIKDKIRSKLPLIQTDSSKDFTESSPKGQTADDTAKTEKTVNIVDEEAEHPILSRRKLRKMKGKIPIVQSDNSMDFINQNPKQQPDSKSDVESPKVEFSEQGQTFLKSRKLKKKKDKIINKIPLIKSDDKQDSVYKYPKETDIVKSDISKSNESIGVAERTNSNKQMVFNGRKLYFPSDFGKQPVCVNCPVCHHHGPTKTNFERGCLFWCFVVFGCLCGWCVCACLWPFCSDCFNDIEHRCHNCGQYLGTYEKFDPFNIC